MFLKVHVSGSDRVVALCDTDVMGKRITDGKIVLDLQKYADFYRGEKVTEQKAVDALRKATSINIVGAKALAAAEKAGVAKYMQAKNIAGVPHLQIYFISEKK
jgi:hypothetical protein